MKGTIALVLLAAMVAVSAFPRVATAETTSTTFPLTTVQYNPCVDELVVLERVA